MRYYPMYETHILQDQYNTATPARKQEITEALKRAAHHLTILYHATPIHNISDILATHIIKAGQYQHVYMSDDPRAAVGYAASNHTRYNTYGVFRLTMQQRDYTTSQFFREAVSRHQSVMLPRHTTLQLFTVYRNTEDDEVRAVEDISPPLSEPTAYKTYLHRITPYNGSITTIEQMYADLRTYIADLWPEGTQPHLVG